MIAIKLPDAIQWSEGMLLSPQHLQQNDIYWHEQLRHRISCLTPHYWGVRRFALQLIKETIVVSELECLLPNGLALFYPGNFTRRPEPLLQLDVSACKAGEVPQRIWLLTPERGTNAACQTDPERRYDSQPGSITADENIGEGDVAVGRLQARFELVRSTLSPSAGLGSCPLVEVMRDAQGTLRISEYLPPMLCLGASDYLGTAGLHNQMATRYQMWWNQAQELADEPSGTSADGRLNASGVRNRMVARQISSALPALSVLLETRTHPFQLYQALAHMVGHIAQFAENPLPLKMTPYLHDDCLPQFQTTWRYIDDAIETEFQRVRQDRLRAPKPIYDAQPFQAHSINGFGRKLPTDIGSELIVEVKPREGQSLEQIGRWLNQADIASATMIPHLRRQRIPGARVRQLGPDEIARHQLPLLADLFAIENRKIELPDMEPQYLFSGDQSLFIQGSAGNNMPAAIYLYQKTPQQDMNV